MAPLIPVLIGAGVLAYIALSKSGNPAGAAIPHAPGSAPSPYGGPSATPPASGGGGSSTPWDTSGVPGVQDIGNPDNLIPGQIDPGAGSTYMGQGGSGMPSSEWSQTGLPANEGGYGPGDGGDMRGVSGQGVNADPGWFSSLFSSSGMVGQSHHPKMVWSEHPNVLFVTNGRGGWLPYYDGYNEGYAPPGGLPIH